MSAPSDESNPYRPPEAEIVAPRAGRRIRFRMIPAAFCGLLGILNLTLFLVTSLALVVTAYRILKTNPDAIMMSVYSPTPRNLLGLVISFCGAITGLYAARAWMAGRWRIAFLLSVVMWFSMVTNEWLNPFH
jgi:hypothetical protein